MRPERSRAERLGACGGSDEGGRELLEEFCPNRRSSSSQRPNTAASCSRNNAFSALNSPISSRPATLHNFAPYPPTPCDPLNAYSWRTGADLGVPHNIGFAAVLRNLDDTAAHPEAAGPGHWNDPDYLGPELGMSDVEAQAQFTMWAMVAAPLVLGNDIRTMSPRAQRIVINPRAIAIDQDTAGVQGRRIARHGAAEVWAKPLANGDRAVALLNRGDVAMPITTRTWAINLTGSRRYRIRDVWTRKVSRTPGPIRATVAPHGAVLLRVSRLAR